MAIGLNKNVRKPVDKPKAEQEAEEVVDDLTSATDEKVSSSPNMKVIVIGVAAIILIVILLSQVFGNRTKTNEASTDAEPTTSSETVSTNTTGISAEDEIVPGAPDYSKSENTMTTGDIHDASEYIKDLNGLDISAVYNVASIDYVDDYVSYETRRAITDDGMEMYWLEADYKGKKYRVQVPFYYFKDLGTDGICRVRVEVLTLSDGGTVISYMRVIDNEE